MKFRFVIATKRPSGTRLPIHDFLDNVNHDGIDVELDIHYGNTSGLSSTYNKAIDKSTDFDFIVFIHDDFHLLDCFFFDKIINSKFDVIGNVGGRQYIPPEDWKTRPFLWTEACRGKASGFVLHKHPTIPNVFIPSSFGLSPLPCVWLDGQMLILNKKAILSGLRFCEDYTFDFYDGSLCAMARQIGLKVGTAPILATHESCGQGVLKHKEEYLKAQRRFISTWFCL